MHGPFDSDQPPELGYQLKLTPRDIYRLGIRDCNAWCREAKGKSFADLSADEQVEVLEQLDGDRIELEALKASLFMAYLVKNTKEGYFSDPIYGGNKNMVGWKMIGFPGARADFMDWIDHPNERYPLGPVSISGERG
jgi:gluconate 2-dehydrogenase gamma chain